MRSRIKKHPLVCYCSGSAVRVVEPSYYWFIAVPL